MHTTQFSYEPIIKIMREAFQVWLEQVARERAVSILAGSAWRSAGISGSKVGRSALDLRFASRRVP